HARVSSTPTFLRHRRGSPRVRGRAAGGAGRDVRVDLDGDRHGVFRQLWDRNRPRAVSDVYSRPRLAWPAPSAPGGGVTNRPISPTGRSDGVDRGPAGKVEKFYSL